MANETTFALISDLVPTIWEGALFYAQHNFVMPALVKSFAARGMWDRKNSQYIETGVQTGLAEVSDLADNPVAFDRNVKSTLSPGEIGKMFLVYDRRVESDTEDVIADVTRDIGYTIGKQVETDLMALFASLTAGRFGDETNAFSTSLLFKGRAILEQSGVPGPYVAVMHTFQYLDIFGDFTALASPANLDIRNRVQDNYYVTQIGDITVVVSGMVPTTKVTDEVQTLTCTGTPTGGTFKLKFAGAETAALNYNATAAQVDTALEALSNIGTAGVVCAGGPFPGTPITVTFNGVTPPNYLSGYDVPLLVLSNNGLTGGTTPTVTPTETTKGSNYATGAIFNRNAMALDLRRPLRIEPQRDASKRATELNATMIYAKGVWQPEYGVYLRSDASAPLN